MAEILRFVGHSNFDVILDAWRIWISWTGRLNASFGGNFNVLFRWHLSSGMLCYPTKYVETGILNSGCGSHHPIHRSSSSSSRTDPVVILPRCTMSVVVHSFKLPDIERIKSGPSIDHCAYSKIRAISTSAGYHMDGARDALLYTRRRRCDAGKRS